MTDKIQDIFLGEANDLLDNLEDLLLQLEEKPTDKETIGAIFRTMHTIKGSSGMCGFNDISHFTHEAETAFDEIRNGHVAVTSKLITLTLQTRDHIREMLVDSTSDEIVENSKKLIQEFQTYIKNNNTNTSTKDQGPIYSVKNLDSDIEELKEADETKDKNTETTWRIKFIPSSDIFKDGTRPHSLLSEIRTLGKTSIIPFFSSIPSLSLIVPTTCYMSWEIILTTKETLDRIKDVFIFLNKDSSVEITQVYKQNAKIDLEPKKLGEILIEKNIISEEQINQALGNQKPLGAILTEKNLVSKEQVQAALAEQEHIKELQEKKTQELSTQTIKVNSEKLDRLIDLVGELVTFNARLGQLSQSIQNTFLSTLSEQGDRLILELRDTTMDMRMLPIGSIFTRFRRLVRDLASDLGKDIELITEGAETELDKTVIEKLNDPLVHLIRNSVDHGIEAPEDRKQQGKSQQGKVTLKAQHAGAFVLISIEDDGAGLNKDRIRQKAIEKKLISENDELSDTEIYDLIFQPGFSTAKNVTSVSGRGVGMDVVKKDITALGGTVSTSSTPGKGSIFTLKLPLTLAIIEGILVQIGLQNYVIPLSNVVECLEFKRPENEKESICSSINIRNEIIPYGDLRTFFNIKDPAPSVEQIVIVNDQDSRIGLLIDKVIGNYQTVIKPLGRLYQHVGGLSGATILGDGSVALILDVYKLSNIIRDHDVNNKI